MRRTAFLALSALILSPIIFSPASPVFAEEIGRAEVDGRPIVLSDDGTWIYADEAAGAGTSSSAEDAQAPSSTEGAGTAASESDDEACRRFTSETLPLSFCLDPTVWSLAARSVNPDAEFGFQSRDQSLWFFVVSERLSLGLEDLQISIVNNAQNAAGFDEVDLLSEARMTIDDQPFGRIAYETTIDGVPVRYSNLFTTTGEAIAQLVIFGETETGEDMSGRIASVTDEIASTLRFDAPADDVAATEAAPAPADPDETEDAQGNGDGAR